MNGEPLSALGFCRRTHDMAMQPPKEIFLSVVFLFLFLFLLFLLLFPSFLTYIMRKCWFNVFVIEDSLYLDPPLDFHDNFFRD
jgi:hypothetical protein